MTEAQIKHMVERFLGWKLPADFSPDAGISFVPGYGNGTAQGGKHVPVGTNLLTYQQADAMVRYLLENIQANPSGHRVCLVIAASDDGDEYGVFSSPEAGTDWADARPEGCVIAYPMIVDAPEFGNTPASSAN